MNKELQDNESIKPGGLGIIGVGGSVHIIKAILLGVGAATLTIKPIKKELPLLNPILDAEFEIIQPKQISDATTNGSGSEDVL